TCLLAILKHHCLSLSSYVIFTGDWAQPVKEAEATNSLADQGVDVISMHVDSPKVIVETAERRGIYSSGFHAVQTELAPNGYLTGTAWDFPSVYSQYVELFQGGKTLMNGQISHLIRGGLKEKFVKLAPFGPAVSAETQAKAEESVAEANAGELVIYQGEIKDNSGKIEVPAGEVWTVTDGRLDGMNWLAEGAVGKVGG
ncbi:BMP family ABC transporter substrate-binding protein, partial [Synechococcales cyanobacterium C]